jgi:hypothetical protein
VPAAIATAAGGNSVTNPDGTDWTAGRTTTVNELPQFGDRVRTRIPDDTPVTGWRAQDFTLAEIKQLGAKLARSCHNRPLHCVQVPGAKSSAENSLVT